MILTLILNDLISGKIIRDPGVMIFPAVLLVKCMINMVQKVWTPWCGLGRVRRTRVRSQR